jgi:hypothetical protein
LAVSYNIIPLIFCDDGSMQPMDEKVTRQSRKAERGRSFGIRGIGIWGIQAAMLWPFGNAAKITDIHGDDRARKIPQAGATPIGFLHP